jgi:hydroxyacyl-ACP dehydratase HTD2-like protein with hotdog domain
MFARLSHSPSLIPRSSRAPTHAIAGEAALDHWISQRKDLTLSETLHTDRVSDLYITLPTRDGTTRPYVGPKDSQALGFGHHLAFFHSRTPERHLRADGTEADFCPPEPFVRRMWAGGWIEWRKPLIVGDKACARVSVGSVHKKGFEGVAPMVFVNQRIEITNEGEEEGAVLEERTHVYLTLGTYRRTAREGMDAPLNHITNPTTMLYFTSVASQCTVCPRRIFRSSSRPVQLHCSDSRR